MRFLSLHRPSGLLLTSLLFCGTIGAAHAQTPQPRNLKLEIDRDLPTHVLPSPRQPALWLRVQVSNLSPDSISGAFRVRYRLDAGPITDTLFAARLRGWGYGPRVKWRLGALPLGAHRVQAWVEVPAGYRDTDPRDDTVTQVVRVVPAAQTEPRLTLVEDYSSSTCQPCVGSDLALQAWMRQSPQDTMAVAIAFQQEGPPPYCYYTNPSSQNRFTRWHGYGVPWVAVNGRFESYSIADTALHLTAEELLTPAFAHLDASYYRDPATGRFTVWSTLTPLADFTGVDPMPHVLAAWVEPQVPATNATNGQTVLHHVSHYVNDARIAPIGAANVPMILAPLTYTPRPDDHVVHPDSLQAVVWVEIYNDVSPILQVVRARRLSAPLGVAQAAALAAGFGFTLAPNPARTTTTLYLTLPTAGPVIVTVRDVFGRVARTLPARPLPAGTPTLPLDVRGLTPGVYHVQVRANDHLRTQRLVVE